MNICEQLTSTDAKSKSKTQRVAFRNAIDNRQELMKRAMMAGKIMNENTKKDNENDDEDDDDDLLWIQQATRDILIGERISDNSCVSLLSLHFILTILVEIQHLQ
jgi:hypothetical protein